MATKEISKEGKKLADMNTMSTGATLNKIEAGHTVNLHGHMVTIILTDDNETIIAYPNRAQRSIDTYDLNAYLELGTFPTGTQFLREDADGSYRAEIMAVTGDCCYQVNILGPELTESMQDFTYAEFINWHMQGVVVQKELNLPAGSLYVPKVAEQPAADAQAAELPYTPKLEEVLEATAAPETDRADRIAELEAKVNRLAEEKFALSMAIGKQASLHATIIAAYEEDIERLEKKAAILNPSPTCKEYCIKRSCSDRELANMNRDGWLVQHMQFMDSGLLHVVFMRDLPQPAVGDEPRAAAAVTSAPAPVASTPLPANQSGVVGNQPHSRELTNNKSRTVGDTRRIPTLAQFEERKQRNADEIAEIMQRGAARHEDLRRQFASSTSPFPTLTGGQSS